jgi:hypothetical protein
MVATVLIVAGALVLSLLAGALTGHRPAYTIDRFDALRR